MWLYVIHFPVLLRARVPKKRASQGHFLVNIYVNIPAIFLAFFCSLLHNSIGLK